MLDKANARFPIKDKYTFLSHCGASPLYHAAMRKQQEIAEEQATAPWVLFERYGTILRDLRRAAARLLKTSDENIAFVKNTSEGMNLIANGYPFYEGDTIITYVHEYPANGYPWQLQERQGRARLVALANRDFAGNAVDHLPVAWRLDELAECLDTHKSTRIVALSHVQFASGFCADLQAVAELCNERQVDLVLDAAQSLGCLPVYPEELGVAAVVSSGWKWLMGPIGTGIMYTSKTFRDKLNISMVGPETMTQGSHYLPQKWQPHAGSKKFESSTSPVSLAAALEVCLREFTLTQTMEEVANEVWRLQDVFVQSIDLSRFRLACAESAQRTSILSLVTPFDPAVFQRELRGHDVICTAREGYLRIAPHYYNTESQLERAAVVLNRIAEDRSAHDV